jgi:serpin B
VAGCGAPAATPASIPPSSASALPTIALSPAAVPTGWPEPAVVPTDVAGIAALAVPVARDPGDAAGVERATAGDAAFAADLFHAVARSATGNLVLSPYSALTALAMTLGGARGTTAAELVTALRAPSDPAPWHAARAALAGQITAPPEPAREGVPFVLEATNALFSQAGSTFEPAFLGLLGAEYGAQLLTVDFAADPEGARAAVNAWVTARTHDRVRDLLGPGTVTDLTRFGLVNAVYFKGSWSDHFPKEGTRPAPFQRADGTVTRIPTMHGTVLADYRRGDGWQAARLWYVGDRQVAMTIIVPDAGRYAEVERRIDGLFLRALADESADWTSVALSLALPRWSDTTAVDLVAPLRALGVRALFEAPPGPGAADLGGIADGDLYVTSAVHEAVIEVDENGTTASAATAVVGGTTGADPGPMSLTVDRPFLYAISHAASGEILFLGRVLDPAR